MSWQMRAAAPYLRTTRKRRYATPARAARVLAAPKSASDPPKALTRRCHATRRVVEGFGVYAVRPRGATVLSTATVIYLHGGAFVGEIQKQHWTLIADVATTVGVEVCVPIYGLAPQYHADDAIRLMHKVFGECSASGQTYLMGDSAGGAVALSATMSWQEAGGQPPLGLTLIAPCIDLALRNPAIPAIEVRDPWLTRTGILICTRAWAGGLSMDDPRVSPLFGDVSQLPPVDLYVGDRDITVADCRLLRDKMPPEKITYHEQPGAVHVYPLLPLPEGRAARRDMVAHVRTVIAKGARQ
ncbi:MAG TPA: alpha/beta hydrolase fold domain-containing protein [Mycobacterium sp.]|jgi:acetyl esterase/lipase